MKGRVEEPRQLQEWRRVRYDLLKTSIRLQELSFVSNVCSRPPSLEWLGKYHSSVNEYLFGMQTISG